MASQKLRAAAIAALERNGGRVTPERLVMASRNKNHPLHKEFMWGKDAQAASKWRIEKAREIISSVRVIIKTETHNIRSVGYVRDPDMSSKQQGYVSIVSLRNDDAYAERALDAEVTRVEAILDRARELAAALGLEDKLETAIKSVVGLHSRSRRGSTGQVVEERLSA